MLIYAQEILITHQWQSSRAGLWCRRHL